MDNPLLPVVSQWIAKVKLGLDVKREQFGKHADHALSFYSGPYDFLYGVKERTESGGFTYIGDEDMPRPSFCMTVNKVAEMVQLFGPVLYHRNPIRQVNPRRYPNVPPELFGNPADPMVQQQYVGLMQQVEQSRAVDKARASLLEHYLNYTPEALDLKTESRHAIDEALIKGLGLLWTETYTPPGTSNKMVGSFYDTVDNLVIDPDAEHIDDAKWAARRCIHPVWEVEQQYGLPEGTLKGNLESFSQTSAVMADKDGDYRRKQGMTNDLIVYWKVFSKMGVGARLHGVQPGMRPELDRYGDYVYLVVCETCEYPLNLPPGVIEAAGADDQVFQLLQWPTPFWADGGWPFTFIHFHDIPRQVWPMAHLRPGLGELKFINWCYSFLAGKVKSACRDLIAVAKSAAEELKTAIISGSDYELIEIERDHGTISEVVQFLQRPSFQGDIYKVIQAVEENFEKRVGLTELMYGQTATQLRSAAEADVKADQLRVRPDDMASKVEEAMSLVARKEAFAARWHLTAEDVRPVMGEVGAFYWQQLLLPSDPNEILHQLEYRIEAGSTRKPNKERDAANMRDAMQHLFQPLLSLGTQTGQLGPVNALVAAWAKSIDLDAEKFLLKPPAPPPMLPGPPGAGPPGAGAPGAGPPPQGRPAA